MDFESVYKQIKNDYLYFENLQCRTLLIGYRTDWRYPPEEMSEISDALSGNRKQNELRVLDSNFGHGAFMYDSTGTLALIRSFMESAE